MYNSFSPSFLIVVVLAILVLFYFVYREERLAINERKRPAATRLSIIKRYKGTQADATMRFQSDANQMRARSYFPTVKTWIPGWRVWHLIAKPKGTLTVTYEKINVFVEEKTCSTCAGRIRAAALVCHLCGHDFYVARQSGYGPQPQDASTKRINLPPRTVAHAMNAQTRSGRR
jgi:hypothetical protein